jgi:hypothetical protein
MVEKHASGLRYTVLKTSLKVPLILKQPTTQNTIKVEGIQAPVPTEKIIASGPEAESIEPSKAFTGACE